MVELIVDAFDVFEGGYSSLGRIQVHSVLLSPNSPYASTFRAIAAAQTCLSLAYVPRLKAKVLD
jgi:hypothetical protein